jgi:hypothetical protein
MNSFTKMMFFLVIIRSAFTVVGCSNEPETTTTSDGTVTTTTTTTTLPFGEAVYVSASGNDANDGLTPSTPVLSLSNGVAIADARTLPMCC